MTNGLLTFRSIGQHDQNRMLASEPIKNERNENRRATDCFVQLTWKSEDGEKLFEQCRAIDISEGGVAVECPDVIPLCASVVVWAPAFQVAALAQVRHCTWRQSIYVLGLEFLARTSTTTNDPTAPDHYELLRLSPSADHESIDRVYRVLARRFHPDNKDTGNAETFLRISEAYRVLSHPKRRAQYDEERALVRSTPRFHFRSAEFFRGVPGEQNRRLAVMCLLYRQFTSNVEQPGLSILELEELTGCTREEISLSLWYSCEKGYTRSSDRDFRITVAGVDYVEHRLAELQQNERGPMMALVSGPPTIAPPPPMVEVFSPQPQS
jgi:hypothetical protein